MEQIGHKTLTSTVDLAIMTQTPSSMVWAWVGKEETMCGWPADNNFIFILINLNSYVGRKVD